MASELDVVILRTGPLKNVAAVLCSCRCHDLSLLNGLPNILGGGHRRQGIGDSNWRHSKHRRNGHFSHFSTYRISLLAGNLGVETGSNATASSATIPWRTALCCGFGARKRVEFAAF